MARSRQQDDTPGPGHNSAGAGLDDPMFGDDTSDEAEADEDKPLTKTELGEILSSSVDTIESLEKERAKINDLIKDEYTVLKENYGIDTKVLRKLVAIRKKDREEREKDDATLLNYMSAMGML